VSLSVLQVIAELDRAGLPNIVPEDGKVLTLCVICPGEMSWTDQRQRWVCDRADCPSQDYPSAIANELHFRGSRTWTNAA
jgi:hypothetical protein